MSDWKFCKMVGRGSAHRDISIGKCLCLYYSAPTKSLSSVNYDEKFKELNEICSLCEPSDVCLHPRSECHTLTNFRVT